MNKLFVLISDDLPAKHKAVQAGHAVAAFMIKYPDLWKNETLVYLKCEQLELCEWILNGMKYSTFKEPDMDHKLTAIACEWHPHWSKLKLEEFSAPGAIRTLV